MKRIRLSGGGYIKVPEALVAAAKAALAAKWSIKVTRGSHLKWTPPGGRPLFTSGTPSDFRSEKNHIARCRRAGLDI